MLCVLCVIGIASDLPLPAIAGAVVIAGAGAALLLGAGGSGSKPARKKSATPLPGGKFSGGPLTKKLKSAQKSSGGAFRSGSAAPSSLAKLGTTIIVSAAVALGTVSKAAKQGGSSSAAAPSASTTKVSGPKKKVSAKHSVHALSHISSNRGPLSVVA